jgi:hypothetical protein
MTTTDPRGVVGGAVGEERAAVGRRLPAAAYIAVASRTTDRLQTQGIEPGFKKGRRAVLHWTEPERFPERKLEL